MAIVLCADSTCDLPAEVIEEYQIHTMPYHIMLEDKEYIDNVNITPEEIYRVYYDRKNLPKTSAINAGEYLDFLRPFVEAGDEVIHFCLGHALSSSYQNCVLAREELGHVYPIDSCNLSSAVGLQVMDAGEMIREGKSAEEIRDYFKENHQCYHASFVIDTLDFLRASGRCSSVAAIATSLLNIRPGIEVDNSSGGMNVGKKYRGSTEKVLLKYVKDKLNAYDDIITDKVFITDSGIEDEIRDMVEKAVLETIPFKKVYHSTASCTISCHCGPRTLGVLFVTKTPQK